MKLNKFLAAMAIAVSASLYSCSCEDLYLGELEHTGELNGFLPASVKGEGYQMKLDQKVISMGYTISNNYPMVTVPVRGTGKSGIRGKGATYDCKEYYTTNNLEYVTFAPTELPVYIFVKQTKNVHPEGFTEIVDKGEVDDVIEFGVGFKNTFPKPVTRGMMTYDGYVPYRYFTLSKNPAELINKKNDFVQEHLARVTLDGVEHEDVYHLYLTTPQYTDDEKYLNDFYPLTYIKGIYVKEGIGVIQAYTSTGNKIDIKLQR